MKRAIVLLAVLAATTPVVFAQSGGHKATGVVTKMETNRVTIKHEPVQSMKWPAMTMAFRVKDKALMSKIKNGQKIDFEFVQEGRDYVVTAVK
jgi:Cu/Ag efflux protein CusF